MKQSVLTLLLSSASAYRPYTDGNTPWYKTTPKEPEIPFPHDYKVPSFGEDPENTNLAQALQWAEKKLNHTLVIPNKPEDEKPSQIPILNFGEDRDMKLTRENLEEAEEQVGHKMATPEKEKEIPMNYFVPNFGPDRDIAATQQHLAKTEKVLKHKLDWDKVKAEAKAEVEAKKPYKVNNLGQDKDVKQTLDSIKTSEKNLGTKMTLAQEFDDFVQEQQDLHYSVPIANKMASHHMTYDDKALTFLQDDPICSSQGCQHSQLFGDGSKNAYPKKWYPNFPQEEPADATPYKGPGVLDDDIKTTIANERAAASNAGEDSAFLPEKDMLWHQDHPKWF